MPAAEGEPDRDRADPLIGRVLDGRYRVDRLLGAGGMGRVYEATQVELGRHVAIKVLMRELSGEPVFLERFRREAIAAAVLGSPHIVDVTDFGAPEDGPPFLVMELLSGESLMDVLRREGALDVSRAVRITVQLLDALADAHEAGIVHRDLKPENVFLVSLAGGDEMVKLLDFGVAKLRESKQAQRLTAVGALVGTPRFAAPEQLRGEEVDARTDVYGAGVVLYGMLTGRPPFPGPLEDLIRAVLEDEPPDVRVVSPAVRPELAAVVSRAMAKAKADRFESAAAMLAALGGTRARSRSGGAKPAAPAAPRPEPAAAAPSAERDAGDREGGADARAARALARAPRPSAAPKRKRTWGWPAWAGLLIVGLGLGGATGWGVYRVASARAPRRTHEVARPAGSTPVELTPQCDGYLLVACACPGPARDEICREARATVETLRGNVLADPREADGVNTWCHDAKQDEALCHPGQEEPADEEAPAPTPLAAGTRRSALTEAAWRREDGTPADRYAISLAAGQRVAVTMRSAALDPLLVLRDPAGRLVAANDDDPERAGATDARLVIVARRAGLHVLEAGAAARDSAGPYELTLE